MLAASLGNTPSALEARLGSRSTTSQTRSATCPRPRLLTWEAIGRDSRSVVKDGELDRLSLQFLAGLRFLAFLSVDNNLPCFRRASFFLSSTISSLRGEVRGSFLFAFMVTPFVLGKLPVALQPMYKSQLLPLERPLDIAGILNRAHSRYQHARTLRHAGNLRPERRYSSCRPREPFRYVSWLRSTATTHG